MAFAALCCNFQRLREDIKNDVDSYQPVTYYSGVSNTDTFIEGAIAQLGERLHGMQEVSGSIPLSSTKLLELVQ